MKSFYIIVLSILFFSCNGKPVIGKDDTVKKCIINRVSVKQSISTIEPGLKYTYYTECGEKITTSRHDVYHIGDTLTFIYKK